MLERINFSDSELEEFRTLAKDIPSEPLDRIHKELREILESNEDILFDSHAHAITKHHIPSDFKPLLEWVPDWMSNKILKLIDERMYDGNKQFHINNNITKLLDIYYSFIKDVLPNKTTKVLLCILMMDLERGISDRLDHNFIEQIKQTAAALSSGSELSNGNTISGTTSHINFFAADPHNPDLYRQFISGFRKDVNNSGISALDNIALFHGVKLYPVLGYKPSDDYLHEIYKVCEEKRIPITSHCGGVRTRTKYRKIEVSEKPPHYKYGEFYITKCHSRAHYKEQFVEPHLWLKVLSAYPNLKLNLAHFGDDYEWKKYRKNPKGHSHVRSTLELLENNRFPNVYADISYAVQDYKNVDEIVRLMQDERYKHRILCGTDYYLNEFSPVRTENALSELYHKCFAFPNTWKLLTMDNPKRFFFDI